MQMYLKNLNRVDRKNKKLGKILRRGKNYVLKLNLDHYMIEYSE